MQPALDVFVEAAVGGASCHGRQTEADGRIEEGEGDAVAVGLQVDQRGAVELGAPVREEGLETRGEGRLAAFFPAVDVLLEEFDEAAVFGGIDADDACLGAFAEFDIQPAFRAAQGDFGEVGE